MIDSAKLLTDLQREVTRLHTDLRTRCDAEPSADAPLKLAYDAARAGQRTALTYNAWREEELTNVAVAWVLACVFIRFLEDNDLVETLHLAGPDAAGIGRARDQQIVFFREHPGLSEREYLEHVFTETAKLPGMADLFDRRHNPLWTVGPTGDAARALVEFWRKADAVSGAPVHCFAEKDEGGRMKDESTGPSDLPPSSFIPHPFPDPTRFLGDLYQDLSEAARKRYALLQTPVFIEQFILDRTLTPAIETFGFREVRMIDPTCGSGHFLLGGFARLFALWNEALPGEVPSVIAQHALDQVFGVDLNPNVVAIARFRLLLAALRACGSGPDGRFTPLRHAYDFKIHVAAGDSLLHGRRFRAHESHTTGPQRTFDTEEVFRDELKHHYEVEDVEALHRILGQQYHAVVGNPPYITVKDRAVSELYRARFPACHRQYSLSVPFMERFFDLAVKGDGTPQQPAGFVGQITSNSFMKREFGKKLIEEYLPRWDLTHVLDTAGAYIPGMGTPTVILFAKNQPPVSGTIRTVLGIRGEPAKPAEPALGLVWQAIVRQIDDPGSVSEWVSAADSPRENFHHHPWSIGGGGAAELKEVLEAESDRTLSQCIDSISSVCLTRLDEVYQLSRAILSRQRVPQQFQIDSVIGEFVRDWGFTDLIGTLFPYDLELNPVPATEGQPVHQFLWPFKEDLWGRKELNGDHRELGRTWWEWNRFLRHKFRVPNAIAFSFVATTNNFVPATVGLVFHRSSPVLLLLEDTDSVRLLGVLNSSAAGFWMKQVFFPKGGSGIGRGIQSEAWESRFEFDATKLPSLPLPAHQPTQLPTALVKTSTAMQGQSPAATLASWGGPESGDLRPWLASARDLATRHRRQLIAWQEELDWQIYEAFGLVEGAAESGPAAVSLPDGIVALECPNGASSSSPGLPSPRGYPGSPVPETDPTPTGLRLSATGHNPVGVENLLDDEPRVARASQPWAGGHSPVGAGEAGGSREQRDVAGTFEVPPIELGERAFEIVLARRMKENDEARMANDEGAGGFHTTWFERHGSTPITEIPNHWPKAYRELVERRLARIAEDPAIRLIEQPEYKRRWNTEPWDEQFTQAARDWLLARLEGYFFEGDRVSKPDAESARAARTFAPATRPAFTTTNQLAEIAKTDRAFQAVAEQLMGGSGFSVPKLVRELVELASVPALPAQRYKPSGLLKRHDWEHVWKLQREEDRLNAEIEKLNPQLATAASDPARSAQLKSEILNLKSEIPPIPVPPKYASSDFKKSVWWSLRGKLDVPKERWISYPGTERTEDPSPVIAWAGWDHAQQARALAEYTMDAKQIYGFPPEKLTLLLAGLLELQPWLTQWHSALDPAYGTSPAEAIKGFLDAECHALGVTREDLERVRICSAGTKQAQAL